MYLTKYSVLQQKTLMVRAGGDVFKTVYRRYRLVDDASSNCRIVDLRCGPVACLMTGRLRLQSADH